MRIVVNMSNNWKKKLREIESLISSLTFASEKASDLINEYCIDLRTQIDLITEKTIEQIHASSQKLHKQVNIYEQNIVRALCCKQNEKINIKKEIESAKKFQRNCSAYLKNLKINDVYVQKFNSEEENLLETATKHL